MISKDANGKVNSSFTSQGYKVHFVPYLGNKVDLEPLACEDGQFIVEAV